MALRWKKDPRPTGLAGVIDRSRGSTLRDGDGEYAWVNFVSARRNAGESGWYWVASNAPMGVPLKNTHETLLPDEPTAKAEAMAYVKACLQSKS
jgi:hypothetical protein